MKIILGLGNPGLRYKFSRHNLGFLVVEKLAKQDKIKLNLKNFNYLFGRTKVAAQNVLLVKPLTFINLSGQAASLIVKHSGIQLKDLLIICDDVNLSLGKIRLRARGSEGGHKGLRSIIQGLGTEDFARLRVGVGIPKRENSHCPHRGRLSNYVLGRFNKKESKIIREAVEEAASCCRMWAKEGIQAAMAKFNRR